MERTRQVVVVDSIVVRAHVPVNDTDNDLAMTLRPDEKRRLRTLRARARLRGVGVHLSRKAISSGNLGGFMLTDIETNSVIDGARYDLTLAAAEERVAQIVADLEAGSLAAGDAE